MLVHNIDINKGDRVVLDYVPLNLSHGERVGTVEKVTEKVVTLAADHHGGAFRSYSRKYINGIRLLDTLAELGHVV